QLQVDVMQVTIQSQGFTIFTTWATQHLYTFARSSVQRAILTTSIHVAFEPHQASAAACAVIIHPMIVRTCVRHVRTTTYQWHSCCNSPSYILPRSPSRSEERRVGKEGNAGVHRA